MYNIVVFNIRKCAKKGISSEIFSFWDRGMGNSFVAKKISPTIAQDDIFILESEYESRNLMTEFNVSHFIVTSVIERLDIYHKPCKEILLEPVFNS